MWKYNCSVGKLILDIWQAHSIAKEANINGVGIAHSVEERLHELEQTIERLRAVKKTLLFQLLKRVNYVNC